MAARSYDIALEALPLRPVPQASISLGIDDGRELHGVVVDVERDEFVRLPALPSGRAWELLSLSPDGTQLVYMDPYGQHRYGLFVYTLATAEQVMFDASADDGPVLAALSPDRRSIATLSVPDDPADPDKSLAAVGLIDVATGQQQRLWAKPGTWSVESVVSWSPDGTRLAVTYTVGWGLGFATVVLDPAGRQIGLFPDTQALHSGNGSWIDIDHLLCARDDENRNLQLTILNVNDGSRHILGPCRGVPRGRLGNRLIVGSSVIPRANPNQFGGAQLLTTDLQGGDPQPFTTIKPGAAVLRLDTWASPPEPTT